MSDTFIVATTLSNSRPVTPNLLALAHPRSMSRMPMVASNAEQKDATEGAAKNLTQRPIVA